MYASRAGRAAGWTPPPCVRRAAWSDGVAPPPASPTEAVHHAEPKAEESSVCPRGSEGTQFDALPMQLDARHDPVGHLQRATSRGAIDHRCRAVPHRLDECP